MVLTTDVLLKGQIWAETIDNLAPLFKRPNYDIFMLCTAIGIMYDQRIESFEEIEESPRNVPRNVMQNNDEGRLDFWFQAAILTTKTMEITEEDRLELAFGSKNEELNSQSNKKAKKELEIDVSPVVANFRKMDFLTQFANFGVTILHEQIGDTLIESMENIKNFLTSALEGTNFGLDDIPDEMLLYDDPE